jgi:hypothetical protein
MNANQTTHGLTATLEDEKRAHNQGRRLNCLHRCSIAAT